MTRLLMAGFETGATLAYGADVVGSIGGAVSLVSTTPTPRNGSYCFKATMGTTTGGTNNAWVSYRGAKVFAHASKTELWYAFGVFIHHVVEGTAPSAALFVARDTASNINTFITIDNGVLRAYYATVGGGGATTGAGSVLLGAASVSLSLDAWHLIEVHLVASTSTTGTCEVYQDGSQVISVTSVRTCQTNANFGSVDFGCTYVSTAVGPGNASSSYHAFDDVRINDTSGSVNNGRPGDGRILALLPSGVGTTIGGTPLTPTGSATNWQNVDDVPPSLSDYNAGSAVGTGETYTLSDPSVSVDAQAVNVIAYALNTDGGGGSVGITTKTDAGTSEGSAQAITATAIYYSRLLEVDPADAGTWSNVKLTALEAGVTIR